jgi:hypothetical protein
LRGQNNCAGGVELLQLSLTKPVSTGYNNDRGQEVILDNTTEVVAGGAGADIAEALPSFPPERSQPSPCSFNRCSAGHTWSTSLALTECPGCKAQVLVALMLQCPVCNEPTEHTTIRMDHVAKGGGIAARCCGRENMAEVTLVELQRQHAHETEKAMVDAVDQQVKRTAPKQVVL